MLYFWCSIYTQKAKEITFLMQLITCPYSSEINRNHQNNVLIVAMGRTFPTSLVPVDIVTTLATGTSDISTDRCYSIFTGLVPPHSLKLGLSYLKTKAHWAISNLVTRPRAHVRKRPRGHLGRQCVCLGISHEAGWEAMRACGRQCSGLWWRRSPPTSTGPLLLFCIATTSQPRSSLLCDPPVAVVWPL
jgi:hypothetical protein